MGTVEAEVKERPAAFQAKKTPPPPATSERTSVTYSAQTLLPAPMSRLQIWALKSFHPRALFIEAAGAIWAFYLLWYHDWMLALAVVVAYRASGLASVWNSDPYSLAETGMGKLALLHLHPINLTVQLVGTLPLLVGVWQHSTELMMAGVSIILLGHIFGWSKFDSHFSQRSS